MLRGKKSDSQHNSFAEVKVRLATLEKTGKAAQEAELSALKAKLYHEDWNTMGHIFWPTATTR